MLAASLSRVPLTAFVTTLSRQAGSLKTPLQASWYTRLQPYANEARQGISRRHQAKSKTRTLKETIMAPAGDTAFNMGKGLVAGASVVGLGALCYYGLGMSSEVGAVEKSILWSEEVRHRIRSTYMYFGSSIGLTAMSAVAMSRSPAMMRLLTKNSWLAIGATFAAMIGTGMLCRSIPYTEGFGGKQLTWMLHSAVLGAVVAPLTMLGGPLLLRAAWYTAGVVGSLSTVAMCAPSEKFLNMGGPLAIGFGLVLASSLGGMFLPPTTALGAGLYSISIYGGLVLFSMFLLYDTQKIIKVAETHPTYSQHRYDPINASMGIYMDTMNIFIRIAMIMSGGGGRRK